MSAIIDAMGLVNQLHKSHGITQRGGKKYTQVVHRMEAFRTVFGLDLGVDTKVIVDDGHRVVVKSIITDSEGRVVGSGMAEEIRGQGNVNKTSALENCETSAIGRALASIGLSGGEYASANEMDAVPRKAQAIEQNQGGAASSPEQSPPAVPAPPEPTPEPAAETQDDIDTQLYKHARVHLQQCKMRSQVQELFMEYKPKIKDIKARNPERAEHFLNMFKEAEAKF